MLSPPVCDRNHFGFSVGDFGLEDPPTNNLKSKIQSPKSGRKFLTNFACNRRIKSARLKLLLILAEILSRAMPQGRGVASERIHAPKAVPRRERTSPLCRPIVDTCTSTVVLPPSNGRYG